MTVNKFVIKVINGRLKGTTCECVSSESIADRLQSIFVPVYGESMVRSAVFNAACEWGREMVKSGRGGEKFYSDDNFFYVMFQKETV